MISFNLMTTNFYCQFLFKEKDIPSCTPEQILKSPFDFENKNEIDKEFVCSEECFRREFIPNTTRNTLNIDALKQALSYARQATSTNYTDYITLKLYFSSFGFVKQISEQESFMDLLCK